MTGRDILLCVLRMWTVSLVYKAIFIGLRMDQNTPPPDRGRWPLNSSSARFDGRSGQCLWP